MLPDAYIVHRAPRRMRLRVPACKGNKAYFSFLENGLPLYPAVDGVEVNALTASVLLHHDLNIEAFAEHAAIDGYFRLRADPRRGKPASLRALEPLEALDRRFQGLTRGELDLPGLAFACLVGAGIYQISIGNIAAPAWYTAFWYAMSIAMKARTGDIVAGD